MRFLILLTLLLNTTKPVLAAPTQAGTFALQGAAQKTRAYLTDTVRGSLHQIDVWFTSQNSEPPIGSFDVDMTKRLHMVVVSDDFRAFYHIHPTLDANGHFRIEQHLAPHERYDVYADATPHDFGKQVFRFTIGDAPQSGSRDPSEPRKSTTVDGYTVSLSSAALRAGASMLDVTIQKRGRPATDLHPYLGAAAHAVFINTSDLSYVHAHPMTGSGGMEGMQMSGADMSDMEPAELPQNAKVDAHMQLHVELAEPGTYRLWLQFQSATGLHVARFVVRAR